MIRDLFEKANRELFIGLSKLGPRRVSISHAGKRFYIPLLCGMGGPLFRPFRDRWMLNAMRAMLACTTGTVLDIGSNVGEYLVKLQLHDEDRPYLGIDANPNCTFYLQEVIRLNDIKCARVIQAALHEQDGWATIGARTRSNGSASLLSNEDVFHYEVPTVRGDELIGKYVAGPIGFIKVDVEGIEVSVLKGLKQTLMTCSPFVYCEIWNADDRATNERRSALFEFLKGIDYRVIGTVDGEAVRELVAADDCITSGCMQDYVLCHQDRVAEFSKALQASCRSSRHVAKAG